MAETGWKANAAIIAALVVLVFYVVGLIWLLTRTGTQDVAWTRAVYIIGGIEALAFGGAGWLWGATVSRAAAEVNQEKTVQRERAEAVRLATEHFPETLTEGTGSPLTGYINAVLDPDRR